MSLGSGLMASSKSTLRCQGLGVIFKGNTLDTLSSGGCIKFKLLLVSVTSVSSFPPYGLRAFWQ